MLRASTTPKLIIPVLLLMAAFALSSCDSLFVNDGNDDKGITARGGYYYFIDNDAYQLRQLDHNLRVVKSWSLSPLADQTRFQGVAFDGQNLWLSVAGAYDYIYQVDARADSLVVLRTLDAPPDGRGTIRDITFDGDRLWVVNSGSVTYEFPPTLYELDPIDGTVLQEIPIPGPEPRALAAVGDNGNAYGYRAEPGLYIADVEWDSIYAYQTERFQFGDGFVSPTPPRGDSYIFPIALCFDGVDFWLVNSSSAGDQLYRLDYEGYEQERVELPYVTPGPIVWAAKDVRDPIPPVINGAVPNTAARGADLTVTITGSNFLPGAGLSVSFGAGITTGQVTFVDGNTIQADISVAADAAFGDRDITVTNPNGQSGVGTAMFTVLSVDPLAGYLWYVDGNSDSLYKMRILDTSIVQSWSISPVAPGGSPQGLAFDGTNIWLSAGGSDDAIIKLNTSGAELSAEQSLMAPPGATGTVREIAFEGDYLYALNSSADFIYQLDTTSGAILDSIAAPSGEGRGIVFADGNLYCNDRSTDSVYVYNSGSSTWTPVFATPIPPSGTESNRYGTGLTWDGVNFWMANSTYEFDYLFQISSDGTALRTYEVPNRGDAQPTGVAFTQD